MLTKEQIYDMVVEQFKFMENSLNTLEAYLEDIEINTPKIGFEIGKIHKEFELLVTLLEIKLEE